MSKRNYIAALSFASLAAISTAVLAADPMGSVVAVEGRPTATGTGGSRALSAGSAVFEGDTIAVGSGNAQMELDDGTKLVVGPSSRLVLQAYLRRNETSAKKVGLKALRGTFRVITGNSPKSAYKITTSNATIGVRGTGFDVRVNDRTLLAVLEGAVNLRGNNGQAVNTASGCGVAEAGPSNVTAQELEGEVKTAALQNEFPYIVDQTGLANAFQLPVENCLPFLPANNGGGAPTVPPGVIILAPIIPAAVIANELLKKDEPISPEVAVPPPTPDPDPNTDPYCYLNYTDPSCM